MNQKNIINKAFILSLSLSLGSMTSYCMELGAKKTIDDLYGLKSDINSLIKVVDPNNDYLCTDCDKNEKSYDNAEWYKEKAALIPQLRLAKEDEAEKYLNEIQQLNSNVWIPKVNILKMLYGKKIKKYQENIVNITTDIQSDYRTLEKLIQLNRLLLDKNIQGCLALEKLQKFLVTI